MPLEERGPTLHDREAAFYGGHAQICAFNGPYLVGQLFIDQFAGVFTLLGQRLSARKFDRQVAEIQIRDAIINGFTALGIPRTVAIS